MSSRINSKVYMDVQIGAQGAGRIIFELFNDLTPKTSANFRGLCTGEFGKRGNIKLHYLNTKIHRIIDGFVIQGGDISNSGGKGGYSIYESATFVDESFARTHSCAGLLSMANFGRNTNSSQFYITLKACPHLDGKNVVFGQVIDGMEIVRKISKVPIDKEDKPRFPIIIIDCGQIGDFKGFLKYDPFKKEVFDELREKKAGIIRDQHAIRKLLSEGLTENQAYEYKKRLEICEKNFAQIVKREKQLEAEQEDNKEQGEQEGSGKNEEKEKEEESQEPNLTARIRQRLGQNNTNRLLDLKLKINKAKVLNSKAALEEEIRENDVNYHKMVKKEQWLQKRKNAELELEAKGLSKDKLYLNRNAIKKEEAEKVDQSFGWNVYGEQASYKAYEKRCLGLQKDPEIYQKLKQAGSTPNYKPTEQALNRLSADIQKQQDKRNQFSRRRVTDQDAVVTYINERNKVFNSKLARNYGVYAAPTKTALEMNSQK